ncbi:MAG TPA: murein biosynthesis integral membrane protein MurJ [Gammaproteobacteria bacterium]|nr:murein biosynthesis integral membrane protein MurJ [Gammaproteobacteria bacterium]
MSKRLLKSTATVSGMTFLSRLLGFVRDMAIARLFGAGVGADAFFVAFKIPNFLRRLFAEGAFSQAFVPVLAEYKSRRPGEVRDLVAHVGGALGGALLLITVLGVLGAPLLIALFAPGFIDEQEKYDLASAMLAITFPYILFISLTALAGAILNTYGRFAVPAFTPVLLNLALIGAALFLAPRMAEPVMALAWGVFVAGVAQLLFQLPFLLRLRLLPRPRVRRRHEGVGKIWKLMLPAIFGSSVAQINLLVDTLIASFLVTGSVSWLYYSDRLVEFPLGVFGIALATVILPKLSQRHAEADPARFRHTLDWGLRWVVLIGVPATVGLMLLAGPMLTTLFQYGAFTAEDVRRASYSLMAYAVGLLGFIWVKVLAAAYFSRQDTRTPVKIALVAMGANMVLNVALVFPLAHAGLALATSLSALLNAGLLYRGLKRAGVYVAGPGWPALLGRVGFACAAMAGLLAWGSAGLAAWTSWGAGERTGQLALWVGAGAAVYSGCLFISGWRPRQMQGPRL